MSRAVWTADTGWTDDGPDGRVMVDERGRIVFVPDEVPTEVTR